jgi:hypothetical protein
MSHIQDLASITTIEQLNRLGLFDFRGLFAALQPPQPGVLRGRFRGEFVGPGWLRRLAGPLLVVTGLGGWWGKDFDEQGNAVNLALREGRLERLFPMSLVEQASTIDGKPGLALHYASDNPLPWPLIVDELRSLTPQLVLGMTLADLGPLRRLALPFVLHPVEAGRGL